MIRSGLFCRAAFSSGGRRLLLGVLGALLLAAPAAANAAAPVIPQTSFSEVTETSASLQGSVAPSKINAEAHFEYVDDASYKESGFATATKTEDVKVPLSVQGEGDLVGPATATGDLTENSAVITNLKVTSGSFTKGQPISGENVPSGATVKAIGAGSLELNIPVEAGKSKAGAAISGEPSTTVSNLVLPEVGSFVPGQAISGKAGKGIKAGTSIVSVDADSLTISQPATETIGAAELTGTTTIAAGSGDIEDGTSTILHVSTSAGTFFAGQLLTGPGIKPGTRINQVSPDEEPGKMQLKISRFAKADGGGVPLNASSPQPIAASISGLAPQTLYHVRVASKDSKDAAATGPEVVFFTLAPAPSFDSCANEIFRSGELSPFGSPSARLPDCRSYEQATPVDKDGGDVQSFLSYGKAADDGKAVVFGSTFGAPGSEGAAELPFFLAKRGDDNWSSQGLQAPARLGEKGNALRGWLPDFSSTFASAIRLTHPLTEALYELHSDGSAPTPISPYAPISGGGSGDPPYSYVGASSDGRVILFESKADLSGSGPNYALLPGGARRLYAWDADSGELTLAGQMNSEAESKLLLPKGTFAGPYSTGTAYDFYLGEEHAISSDGSVFFTSASDGQLYQRLNPTAPQSNPGPKGYVEGGHCVEPDKACTIHISASQKSNGIGTEDGTDPAGPQRATFMAASADGKVAFFASSEKLTDDANTGPEQPPAQIGAAELSDPDPGATKDESVIPAHALGIAVDEKREYIYWAEPQKGTIARAKLNADGSGIEGTPDSTFIKPGETEAVTNPDSEPGVYHSAPSRPRYVAIGPCAEGGECVYWTNMGPPQGEDANGERAGGAIQGGGTIGRARLKGDADAEVEDEFIKGPSNPQGIAVNSDHIYWGNAQGVRGIGWSTLEGKEVNQLLIKSTSNEAPSGVALSDSHLYFGSNEGGSGESAYIIRFDLEGKDEHFVGAGAKSVAGVAVDSGHVYWASQGEAAIGRASLDLELASREKRFIELDGKPAGVAAGGTHLYYSSNGESSGNPGRDLYRYRSQGAAECSDPRGCLDDLTPERSGDGAEFQGFLGASADGSYVYFVANAVLDNAQEGSSGDCDGLELGQKTGRCNLYLWHDGTTSLIGQVGLGKEEGSDNTNLVQSSSELSTGAERRAKTSLVPPDGRTLVFRSVEQLTGYDNDGTPEYYRYRADNQLLTCITCNPSGVPPSSAPTLNTTLYPSLGPSPVGISSVASRHLSANGSRFFFETTESLVPTDANGQDGCASFGTGSQQALAHKCQDVYEWEAPGSGTCVEHGQAWSQLNQGCIYLISTGKSAYPSFFIDASESGDDVFFMTRDSLVGQDSDQIQDIYDARVNGGLVSQNVKPQIPCEIEGCLPDATPPPAIPAPPNISGPADPKPKRCKGKKCHKSKHGHKKTHRHKHRKGGSKSKHGRQGR
jgi:hypothetical protein